MPRIIINPASASRRYEGLVRKLSGELTSPGDGPMPLIVERHLPVSNSRHVHVIWDDWGRLDDEERSTVITRAYEEAEGEAAASNITVALGVRPEEAIIFGLLPFIVMPRRAGDSERADYRKVIEAEARRTVFGAEARELRYASLEEAEQAVKRLRKAMPRTSWEIVRESDRGE